MKFEVTSNTKINHQLAIIIPAYNEEASIELVIDKWITIANQYSGNLIILNDGGLDKTAQLTKEKQKIYDNLIFIDKDNSGHAQTCIAGYKWAIDNGYQWIFQTDSDDQTLPEDFSKFWDCRNDNPFIFGHRKKRGDGFIRLIISKILSLSIFMIFAVKVRDANVPYRLMNSHLLKEILPNIPQNLFLGNAYLSVLISKKTNIKWIEIGFKKREAGTPSVKLIHFFKVGLKVIKEFRNIMGH